MKDSKNHKLAQLVGGNIAMRRKLKKWTQAQLGEMLGIGTDSGREKTILPEISLGRLGDYLAEFEDAVYTFEKDEISSVLKEVFRYSFRGENLADSLDQVNSAVSESDFMSALTYFSNFLTNAAKEESFNG